MGVLDGDGAQGAIIAPCLPAGSNSQVVIDRKKKHKSKKTYEHNKHITSLFIDL